MHRNFRILAALVIGMAFASAPKGASAIVIFTISEVGSDVVATTNGGSLDLTGLTFASSNSIPAALQASGPMLVRTGSGTNFLRFDGGTGISGPTSIGTGTFFTATSGSGPLVGIRIDGASDRSVHVPTGYTSGDPLGVSTATWAGESFASLGLDIGSYTWDWSGDSISVNVVPEPATLLLLATGLTVFGARNRRLH